MLGDNLFQDTVAPHQVGDGGLPIFGFGDVEIGGGHIGRIHWAHARRHCVKPPGLSASSMPASRNSARMRSASAKLRAALAAARASINDWIASASSVARWPCSMAAAE
ncbi:hypothetical protein G6F24_018168 [Rhizopus arrhizus]|nr:hypothetical protein G6F24_018168 [Rhizopus arrhizus]